MPRLVTLGVHVVDVLVRPVEEIPVGQGGTLVEEIRITPEGSAGGTAITLAKLGATVHSAGAIGNDELGEVLVTLLHRFGVDTSLLVRRDGVQTSASVLPIRPDGSRPAFHVVGANAAYGSGDAPWRAVAEADAVHLGAPEFMGGEEAAERGAGSRVFSTASPPGGAAGQPPCSGARRRGSSPRGWAPITANSTSQPRIALPPKRKRLTATQRRGPRHDS